MIGVLRWKDGFVEAGEIAVGDILTDGTNRCRVHMIVKAAKGADGLFYQYLGPNKSFANTLAKGEVGLLKVDPLTQGITAMEQFGPRLFKVKEQTPDKVTEKLPESN